MCGIIGILGGHEVSPQLVEALKRLEYRGYDSAGVATMKVCAEVSHWCGPEAVLSER